MKEREKGRERERDREEENSKGDSEGSSSCAKAWENQPVLCRTASLMLLALPMKTER